LTRGATTQCAAPARGTAREQGPRGTNRRRHPCARVRAPPRSQEAWIRRPQGWRNRHPSGPWDTHVHVWESAFLGAAACTLPVTIWGSTVPLHRPLVAAPRMHSRRTLACTAGPPSRRRMCGREGRHKPPRNKLRLIRLPFNATHYRWASRPCRWPSIGHDRRASWCAARAHDPIPIPNTNAEPDLA
jgi:hypothetical protein